MARGQSGKAGTRIGVDERAALAGFGNIGVIEHGARLAIGKPAIDARDQFRMRNRLAGVCHQRGGDIEDPVDIDRRSHIRLDLGDDAGDRQGDHIAGALAVKVDIADGLGAKVDAGRADRRAGGVAPAAADACAERGHHHIDIAEADGRSRQQPAGLGSIRCQRMADFGPVDDVRQQIAPVFEAKRIDDGVVILPGAEIAEGETRLRRIGRANACEVEIEPILAVQRRFGAIKEIGRETVHMRELGALLAGVEAGAGRLEAGAVVRLGCKRDHRRCGARIEPQPGIADRCILAADEPRAVTLSGDGNGGGARRKTGHFFTEAA